MKTKAPQPTRVALQRSLTRVAGATAAAGLTWLALWVALAPPEGIAGPWLQFGIISATLALPCAAVAVKPEFPRANWVPALCTGSAFAALAWIDVNSGLVGWWGTTELAALLALATSLALSLPAALPAEVAVLAGVTIVLYQGTVEDTVGAGTVAMAAAGVRVLVAATAVLLANTLLRTSARRTDALLHVQSEQRGILAVEERSRRTDRALRRFLHDSGMNSLEAVSRGVPATSVPALRERCAQDAERWLAATATATDDTETAFKPALAEAHMRGLQINAEFVIDGLVPAAPLEALVAAAAEALRNVAKHAAVGSASLRVHVTNGQALVHITDEGRGITNAVSPQGMGIDESIRQRLADVGGRAEVRSGPSGGTRVTLLWPATPAAAESAGGSGGSDLGLPSAMVEAAWVAIALTAVGALVSTAVNWWSVQTPWLLTVIGLALAATGAWLLVRWQRGHTDSFDVGVAAAAVAIATFAMPVADPFCSAASGTALLPDGRLVIVVILGVLLASWRASLAVLGATLLAFIAASTLWHVTWPMCVPQMLPNAIGLTVVALAGVAFGEALRSQEAAARAAFASAEAATLEVARQRADDLVRQQWSIAAVSEARDLLREVADTGTDINDPALREQARDTAARLRAIVRAREIPADLGTALTGIVEAGRLSGFPVTIEGDISAGVDTTEAAQVAAEIEQWWEAQGRPPRAVVVTLSTFAGVSSVLVQAEGDTVASAASRQPGSPAAGGSPNLVAASGFPSGQPPATDRVKVEAWSEAGAHVWRAEWSTSSPGASQNRTPA